MVARAIPETAAVTIGSLGRKRRPINCKLGHSTGKFEIVETSIALGMPHSNARWMEVTLRERSKGMNGTNGAGTPHKSKVFRLGSKGSLLVGG